MSIEQLILDGIRKAGEQGLCTQAIVQAHAFGYNAVQVQNALRRLRRQRRIEYVGSRSAGHWRVLVRSGVSLQQWLQQGLVSGGRT